MKNLFGSETSVLRDCQKNDGENRKLNCKVEIADVIDDLAALVGIDPLAIIAKA